ncbi:MAG: PocR ligand-binding domain-containing protein [Desulfobacterales bacterium]
MKKNRWAIDEGVKTGLLPHYADFRECLSVEDAIGEVDIGRWELADIIDTQAVQAVMEDFYALTGIPMSIIDRKGEILVGVGWQDICTRFHRIHPETRRHCIESSTLLSAGVSPGESKLYKCKNNMWDVATPLMVGNRKVGNIFSGQFFFEDDPIDYELFRRQAGQYGFDEQAYIAALEEVPRLSRESVNRGMAFFKRFADLLSRQGYNNIKLIRAVAEKDALMDSLRESRRDLNRAQAVSHTGSWRLNVKKNALFWSEEAHRIFGVPEDTPLTYETFLTYVHPEDREFVDRKWKKALNGDLYDLEHRILVDDTVKWVRERAELEFDQNGNLLGGFGTVQDITELKQFEEELRKTRDELELRVWERTAELEKLNDEQKIYVSLLEKSNRELEDFAHVASHDLQEPLRKIRTFADRLFAVDQGNLNAKTRDYLQRMQNAAGRMQALVQDLLKYSRAASSQDPFTRFNLNGPVEDAVKDLMLIFEETQGSISIGKLPEIDGDEVQMIQLFQNLIGNGLKYRSERKPIIHIRTVDSDAFPFFEIHVEDNGIGFDETYLDKIFKPFQRLHGRDAPYKGTGMGLAICRRIVERHGGFITAHSKPGKGSTFIIQLPKQLRI